MADFTVCHGALTCFCVVWKRRQPAWRKSARMHVWRVANASRRAKRRQMHFDDLSPSGMHSHKRVISVRLRTGRREFERPKHELSSWRVVVAKRRQREMAPKLYFVVFSYLTCGGGGGRGSDSAKRRQIERNNTTSHFGPFHVDISSPRLR